MSGWSPELSERFPEQYETLRGMLRQRLVSRQLGEHIKKPPARVCDVGGGAGHQAIPLARLGYEVTILDPSEEMLEKARDSLASEDGPVRERVRMVCEPGEEASRVLKGETFDAVLCHGVLMYLEDPGPLIRAMGEVSRPGAIVSILTKNADALAMRPALEGRYRDALEAFDSNRDSGRLGVLTRAHTVGEISGMLAKSNVETIRWYGVRVFADHLGEEHPGPDFADMLEAEWEAGRRDPYRGVGRMIHLVGRKK